MILILCANIVFLLCANIVFLSTHEESTTPYGTTVQFSGDAPKIPGEHRQHSAQRPKAPNGDEIRRAHWLFWPACHDR